MANDKQAKRGGFTARELLTDVTDMISTRVMLADCYECGMGYRPSHPGCKHCLCKDADCPNKGKS